MSRQYKNFIVRLEPFDMHIVTSMDDYIKSVKDNKYPEITLECINGHQLTFKITSLHNKIAKHKKEDNYNICTECAKPEISGEELSVIEKCAILGFEYIEYQNRNVTYKCVCGNIATTFATNLLRDCRKVQCVKCQNEPYKNKHKDIAKYFESQGCELLSKYVNRHTPVKYRCICGAIAKIRYGDFTKGKRCNQNCKAIKFRETCQHKYGVDNVFQLKSVKDKSKETCKEKYGVEYCMQSPEIFKKAMSTSYHRKKTYISPDGKYKWIVQGYEPQCIRDLLEIYKPTEIIAGEGQNVPSSKYMFNGKKCTWHPDIYIPSLNKLIEVKSTWTYNRSAQRIKAKVLHCKYDCEVWIYDRNKLLEKICFDNDTKEIRYLNNIVVLGEKLS